MVRCNDQLQEQQNYQAELCPSFSQTTYTCCPGWTQVHTHSHGCNKPVCTQQCQNGGKCVSAHTCWCPTGYSGTYCDKRTIVYSTPSATQNQNSAAAGGSSMSCVGQCQNGGTCYQATKCACPPGYCGSKCESQVDFCKLYKPCDHICYSVPGSYKCTCKDSFNLQPDGTSCRSESKETELNLEGKDMEGHNLDSKTIDSRLIKLERMASERQLNEVSKRDLNVLYENLDKIMQTVDDMNKKIKDLTMKISIFENMTSPKIVNYQIGSCGEMYSDEAESESVVLSGASSIVQMTDAKRRSRT